jgi:hypothetical protein
MLHSTLQEDLIVVISLMGYHKAEACGLKTQATMGELQSIMRELPPLQETAGQHHVELQRLSRKGNWMLASRPSMMRTVGQLNCRERVLCSMYRLLHQLRAGYR